MNNINSKEKFCTRCGRKFIAVGREVICPDCKAVVAAETKRAAVERAKARSYAGEACPVRISARARGFIEAVAEKQGTKFIPALDKVLEAVCKDYGFTNWNAVPEHKTARRTSKAATPAETPATPAETPATTSKSVTMSKPATTSKAAASKAKAASKAAGKSQASKGEGKA